MKRYGVIYKITNRINGKVYIGQTTKDFDIRYHNNIVKYTHNRHLKFAIKRYGIENFNIEKCIDIAFNQSELNDKEKHHIQIYNSYLDGYNLTLGGEGIKGLPRELHGMYGVHRFGDKNPFYGKSHTYKTKKMISKKAIERDMSGCRNPNYKNGEKIKGSKNPMYGITPKERMSQETYKRWLEKLDENHKGSKNPNSSKVICLETKEIFGCIKDALKIYGNIGISANCRGKCKSAGKLEDGTKLHWMYYNEYLKKVS